MCMHSALNRCLVNFVVMFFVVVVNEFGLATAAFTLKADNQHKATAFRGKFEEAQVCIYLLHMSIMCFACVYHVFCMYLTCVLHVSNMCFACV